MGKLRNRLGHMSLGTKLKLLMFFLLIPLAALICFLLFSLARYSGQYDSIIQNLTVASEFSLDFKSKLDNKVYRFIISGRNFEEFNPFEDIEQARGVVFRLEQTTTVAESRKQLRMIGRFLDNLEKMIGEIRDNDEGYDWNISKWDGSIIPTSSLVTESMYQYIYYETRMLADIRQQTSAAVKEAIFTISIASGLLLVLLCVFAMRMSNSITRPINALCKNIRMVGEGDFTVRSVESHNDEIQTLSDSFDYMVERMRTLMENIRQEQQNLRQTELKLLQAQINPHFLYNTFDTIIWLAEDHQDEQVVEMVTSISNYFRVSLSKGRDRITIREEEQHVCSYLEIQQFRYRDILTYEICMEKELYDFSIPKLTLQPLVENALYHGIKKKRGGGKIQVRGILEQGDILLCVTDDGVGISQDALEKLRESIEEGGTIGYGLSNVQERIRLYFGREYGLAVDSVPGQGTRVTVRLPAKESPPFS